MADFKISELTAAGTLTGAELVPAVQAGATKSITPTQIRQQGGNISAQNGTSAATQIGNVGPLGEAGTRWGLAGNSVLYRDTHGLALATSGVKVFTIKNDVTNDNFQISVNSFGSVTTATGNMAIGWNTLTNVTTGTLNVAIGSGALLSATTASLNTAIGRNALRLATNVQRDTSIGDRSLAALVTGDGNTAVGAQALTLSNGQGQNTAIGFQSMQTTTGGAGDNTAVGHQSLNNMTGIGANTAIGYRSGFSTGVSGAIGNVCVGAEANAGPAAGAVTAIGHQANQNNASVDIVAIGTNTLKGNSSDTDVAIGYNSTTTKTGGGAVVAIGANTNPAHAALHNTTSVGYASNTTDVFSVAYGWNASATGSNGTAVGSNTTSTGLGSAAIGTDSFGSGATSVAEWIKLGTDTHTVAVDGRSRAHVGASITAAGIGGIGFQSSVDALNVGVAETTLRSTAIPANTLSTNGQSITAEYSALVNANAGNKQIRAYFAGTLIFDSTAFTVAGAQASTTLKLTLVRESATVVRVFARYYAGPGFGGAVSVTLRSTYTRLTLLNLGIANNLDFTGQDAAGGGNIFNGMFYIDWHPEA